MRQSHQRGILATFLVLLLASVVSAQTVTSPKQHFGFNIGDDYQLATYTQFQAYWEKLDKESDRMRVAGDRQDRRRPPAADGDHHARRRTSRTWTATRRSRASSRSPRG